MKANNQVKVIDILYPDEMKEAIPQSLHLCEGFITILIQSSHDSTKIKISQNSRCVESNDSEMKIFLDLVIKSKKLDAFYRQFLFLQHGCGLDLENRGVLICRNEGKEIKFEITEISPLPDLSLSVSRKQSEKIK